MTGAAAGRHENDTRSARLHAGRLWGIFRFELAYQLRRAFPWLIFAGLVVFAFLFTRDGSLGEVMFEDHFVNSPFLIAGATVFGGIFWTLLAAAIAGDAAARDVSTRMHPLVYTTAVGKGEYLGGRFLAALALNALILLAVPVGNLLSTYAPGVHPDSIGPFRPAAYLAAYAFIALPNAFAATAIQFALATRSGRAMAAYLGSLLLFFVAFFIASLLLFKQGLGTLLDPLGIRFLIEDVAHDWTTFERRWRIVGLEGAILTNRLLWIGVGAAALALTHLRFRFEHRTERTWWRRGARRDQAHAPMPTALGVAAVASIVVPHAARAFGFGIEARKTLAVARSSFRMIATSWAGLAMLVALPLMTVIIVLDQMTSIGAPLVPTTTLVLRELTGGLAAALSAEPNRWIIVPLLIVFFAGELVWRERESGVAEITDALPGPEWTAFLGKLLGLVLALAAFMAALTTAGMLAQTIRGHDDYEIGLYVKVLFGLQLPEYALVAVLAMLVHVVVNHKYVGHLVAIIAYAFIALLASMLGIEHNLLVYARGPGFSYTEMRGFGASLGPWGWFKLYWAAWALLLTVAASLLWVRGRENGFRVRLRQARQRLGRATIATAAVAVALVAVVGGFIFYNTNVVNEYLSSDAIEARRAEYERRYRRYENAAQPQLTATTLRVEIQPERRVVDIRGSHRLVNGSTTAIDTVLVATGMRGVETRALRFDRAARLVTDDLDHGHRIYALASPLRPGETLRMDFDVHVERRGFGNDGVDPSLAPQGSSFDAAAWTPSIGYRRDREILGAAARREHGLPPRPVIASLYEAEGREPAARGGGVAFDATVGTAEDQVAVAPGALRRTWTEGGRRWFQYVTDAPIGGEWAIFSASYAVHEGRWNDVAIRVFHHPRHTAHLDRTMRGARASLDYFSRQFGPYPYRHLTIAERPGAPGAGLHADASMISHGESFASWIPRDEQRLDFPYAVTAHEMAHQWTLPYARVEGAPFLSEGLAWYSAMQLVRESRGEGQLRRLLSFMRQPHPHRPIRRGEPLLRALDPYQSYRKGPFAMFALSEYVGVDRVNGALRTLIRKHDAPAAPAATTLDLYRELRAVTPDSLQYLLHDLFEVNTFWQLDAERVTAKPNATGGWQVTLDVRARKMVYDSAGVEREVPMDEWVPIGVFGARAPGTDELSAPLYLRMHRVRSGAQTISVTVPRKPVLAGVDPHHLLDWVEGEDDDNVEGVE